MAHTVLVADDSRTIRTIVEMALKASPYQIVEASSARQTMDALGKQPDVILLDYFMPDGSGYEVCRAIKQNASTQSIPIVMMGGSYKDFDESRARQAGADEIIVKPFKTDQLIGALESALSGEASAQQQQSARATPAPQQQSSRPNPAQQQQAQQQAQQRAQQQQQAQAQQQQQARQAQRPSPQQHSGPAPPPNPFAGGGASRPNQRPTNPNVSQPPAASSPGQSRPPQGMTQQSAPQQRPEQPNPAAPSRPQQGHSEPSAAAAPSSPAAAGVDRGEMEQMIKQQVRETVRDELPGLLRNVMGDLFQQKILPRLMKHSDDKIAEALDDQLTLRVQEQVRVELERLLAEE